MKFNEKLKILRGTQTQEEVANAVGIKQCAYCLYEKGLRVPKDSIKVKLANYFNTTVQELFFTEWHYK